MSVWEWKRSNESRKLYGQKLNSQWKSNSIKILIYNSHNCSQFIRRTIPFILRIERIRQIIVQTKNIENWRKSYKKKTCFAYFLDLDLCYFLCAFFSHLNCNVPRFSFSRFQQWCSLKACMQCTCFQRINDFRSV